MGGDKKRRQGKQQTASRETTNGALTRGALDKKHITKTYRQGLPVCDCGGVGQQLSTIEQQFFLYSLFIGQQLSTIGQHFFSTLFLLDNNYPQLTNNFFSTPFLLDNNYRQLANNGICLIQFGSDLFSLAQICFVLFCSMVQTPVNS